MKSIKKGGYHNEIKEWDEEWNCRHIKKKKKKQCVSLKGISKKVDLNYMLHTNAAFKAPKEGSQRMQTYAR